MAGVRGASIEGLAGIVGREGADRLAGTCGTMAPFYVSPYPCLNQKLRDTVGPEAAGRLSRSYGGDFIRLSTRSPGPGLIRRMALFLGLG